MSSYYKFLNRLLWRKLSSQSLLDAWWRVSLELTLIGMQDCFRLFSSLIFTIKGNLHYINKQVACNIKIKKQYKKLHQMH